MVPAHIYAPVLTPTTSHITQGKPRIPNLHPLSKHPVDNATPSKPSMQTNKSPLQTLPAPKPQPASAHHPPPHPWQLHTSAPAHQDTRTPCKTLKAPAQLIRCLRSGQPCSSAVGRHSSSLGWAHLGVL
mmetsp:Transcript_9403/g.23287  ORF Transcript_9403/g.23287 Transcript_9403/m.23287 type:complete len:129 (+) Transcript_9403:121-507(+)